MKLLLPYAHDIDQKLVHIDDAHKGLKYTCPHCAAELLLRISRIPEGQKHHRRNHFAHKGNTDHHCSESFLHKFFKEKCTELIKERLDNKQSLNFVWQCIKCQSKQTENLLNNIVDVIIEYDLGICKPDIALLDINGQVITVIEVIVSHKPSSTALQYYKDHKIKCIQIKIDSFEECENIEHILTLSKKINISPNQICDKCCKIVDEPDDNKRRHRNIIQTNHSEVLKEQLIQKLEKQGGMICKRCGCQMQVMEKWSGGFYLGCENPRCYYEQNIDTFIWGNNL